MWDRFRGTAGVPSESKNNSSNRNNSMSWQPRSSVIAAQQAGGNRNDNTAAGGAGYKYSIKGGGPPPPRPPPPRPPREFEAPPPTRRLPPNPPRNLNRDSYRDSTFRPASSIYSQPSPLVTNFAPQVKASRFAPQEVGDISPPSSPELQTPRDGRHDRQPTPDISPIDEDIQHPFSASHSNNSMSAIDGLPSQRSGSAMGGSSSVTRTNIPMMRRERRQQKEAEAESNRLRPSPSRDQLQQPIPIGQSLKPMDSSERLRQPAPVGQSLRPKVSTDRLRQPIPIGQTVRPMGSREGLRTPVGQGILRPIGSREGLRQPAPVDHGLRSMTSRERLRGQVNPRWDPMTGEMTTSTKGRPSQVKPVEYARGLGKSGATPSPPRNTNVSPVPPKSPSSFGDRMRQMTGRSTGPPKQISDTDPAAGAFAATRPGWRGASGRTALVEPVKDTTEVAPLKIPPKSNQRATSPQSSSSAGADGGLNTIMASPPISPQFATAANGKSGPETQMKDGSQIASGSAGKSPALSQGIMGTMASSIRRIIPSSQQQPTVGSGHDSGNNSAQAGYPSPPLSGSSPTAPDVSANAGTRNDINALAKNDVLPLPSQARASSASHNSNSPVPSPTSQGPIRRKQVAAPSAHLNPSHTANHRQDASFSSSVYSQQPDDPKYRRPLSSNPPSPNLPDSHKTSDNGGNHQLPGAGPDSSYAQPPSHFSVTTYATSGHTTTPRESFDNFAHNGDGRPPLPTPPKEYAELNYNPQRLNPHHKAQTFDSMMDRQRPKLRNNRSFETDSEPVKISLSQAWMTAPGANSAGIDTQQNSPPRTRKDAKTSRFEYRDDKESQQLLQPKGAEARSRHYADASSRPPSSYSMNNNKDLPIAPPEASAESTKDRVAMLNAQISSLGNRRININRSIKQMTELMPTDNLMATPDVIYKREMEKRKVEDLKKELADVQREEHELGMKLHRAYKRLDRAAEYEPTSLWVRRATG